MSSSAKQNSDFFALLTFIGKSQGLAVRYEKTSCVVEKIIVIPASKFIKNHSLRAAENNPS
jgi:hypothetical protein